MGEPRCSFIQDIVRRGVAEFPLPCLISYIGFALKSRDFNGFYNLHRPDGNTIDSINILVLKSGEEHHKALGDSCVGVLMSGIIGE